MSPSRAWLRAGLRMSAACALSVAIVGFNPATSWALPTASFVFAPAQPAAGEPVRFDFTGSCDEPPCRIQWRWFQDGGSSLGTSRGEGEHVVYAFDVAGSYSVVAKITNGLPTHGTASATQAVVVTAPPPPPPPPPVAVIEDGARVLALDGWSGRDDADASSGGYRIGHGSASIHASGGRVTYVARIGPGLGRARITVDGVVVGRVDLSAADPGRRAWSYRLPASATPHVVGISPARARAITLDEFVLHRQGVVRRLDDSSARIAYGDWRGSHLAGASGGTVRTASTPGAVATVSFTGSTLSWVTVAGPGGGRARVTIDGTDVAAVDNWAAATSLQVERVFSDLGPGPHTATVTVLPPSATHPGSSGVAIDAFVVPRAGDRS